MLLYLIRHGDPDYTTDSLTERGIAQAEAVGKRDHLHLNVCVFPICPICMQKDWI